MDTQTIERPVGRGKRTAEPPAQVKTLNLALQGGGAHGAFAWGVLDRLLEDERIAFEGVSATSAGAISRWVGRHAPTEMTCVPAATHASSMTGVGDDVTSTTMSASRTAPCTISPDQPLTRASSAITSPTSAA